jgi:hypothetical protein
VALSNAAIFSKQFFHREKIILLGANNVHKSRLSRHILHEEFSPFIAGGRFLQLNHSGVFEDHLSDSFFALALAIDAPLLHL